MKKESTFHKYLKITGLPVLFAGLCCLSPIIILLLGLGSVGFASSLADTLYGDYKWYFRLGGLIVLVIALVLYFRDRGICTLDAAKRKRNEILNTTLIATTIGVLGYIVWLYVIVHYWGVWLNLWV